MKRPPLRYFRTKNFKAIRDSGRVEFGWLTVFIGNNGSGKSSLVEAMETFRGVVMDGVDTAFLKWRGFQQVWNKSRERKRVRTAEGGEAKSDAMQFRLGWCADNKAWTFRQKILQRARGNSVFIVKEEWTKRQGPFPSRWTRNSNGQVLFAVGGEGGREVAPGLDDGYSAIKPYSKDAIEPWQFLSLEPDRIGQPWPEQQATQHLRLAKDGRHLAQYLNEIRELDPLAFAGILDALRFVLPYAADLQPTLSSELERAYYLKMKESGIEIPGWLLSTGTLRILAILAVLRHPNPPPLVVIEEVENGLDPRTLGMLVEEFRAAVDAKRTQIILTTHSPYLLDLLDLSHIVIVERKDGETTFKRPDHAELSEWSTAFSPGQLYTMGHLTRD